MIWFFFALYAMIGVAHFVATVRKIGRAMDGWEQLGALLFCILCWPAFWIAGLFD